MQRLPLFIILASALLLGGALCNLKRAAAAGPRSVQPAARNATRPVLVHATGRGRPEINLTDGRALAPVALDAGRARKGDMRPRALAAADFDEDGVPDLVCAYATDEGGLFVVRRGNADAIYPHSAEAQARRAAGTFNDEPFLAEAWSASAPLVPDFVAAGDFDGDGHADITAAARGGTELTLLRGDGRGAFAKADAIKLPGMLTAFVAGELGRHDGRTDIALGVRTEQGARLVVYADAHGALRNAPQTLALPKGVTALAVGQFDDDAPYDLAAAVGDELVVVRGTNRIAGWRDEEGEKIAAARVERRAVGFEIAALAAGDFAGDARAELALLSPDGALHLLERASAKRRKARAHASMFAAQLRATASVPTDASAFDGARLFVPLKVSTRPKSDLLVGGADARALHIISLASGGESLESKTDSFSDFRLQTPDARLTTFDTEGRAIAALPMRLNKDALSDLVVLTETQVEPVVLQTAPVTVRTVTTNADSGVGSLREAIDAANASPGLDEIRFDIPPKRGAGDDELIVPQSPLASITDPLTLDGINQTGLRIVMSGGAADAALVINAGATAVSGLACHGFSNTDIFLQTNGGNIVEDCYFGIDRTGTVTAGGTKGVTIANVPNNQIGGPATAARNVFGGHAGDALVIAGAQASANTVAGNYFGVQPDGTSALAHAGRGVFIDGAPNNTIGGAAAGARNVVAASGAHGIEITGETAAGNLVAGNLIGTDATGNAALGNAGAGVKTTDVPDIIIASNVVSANGGAGTAAHDSPQAIGGAIWLDAALRHIAAQPDAPAPAVQGMSVWIKSNFVGTNAAGTTSRSDAAGTAALANAGDGILIEDVAGVIVGGPDDGDGNVIANNLGCGVHVRGAGAQANDVLGNMIGMDATGTVALGNAQDGIRFDEDLANPPADYSFIVSNVISGNGANGVHAVGTAAGVATSVPAPQGGGVGMIWISHGVRRNATGAPSVVPVGNRIGTNLAGDAAVPNVLSGVLIENAPNIRIGEDLPGHNLIAGNGRDGIEITGALAAGTQIVKTYIGTNLAGDAALGNGRDGVHVEGDVALTLSSNQIGGNTGDGVLIDHTSTANATRAPRGVGGLTSILLSNRIGGGAHNVAQPAGDGSLGNGGSGVHLVNTAKMQIGGPTTAARNIISANGANGIEIEGASASGNVVEGNYIGTSDDGTAAAGNAQHGILVKDVDALVGTEPLLISNDLIAGNGADGIRFVGSDTNAPARTHAAASVSPAGGFRAMAKSGECAIGINANGMPLPNGGNGVSLINASNIELGFLCGHCEGQPNSVSHGGAGADRHAAASPLSNHKEFPRRNNNTIAYNHGAGVYVSGGANNRFYGNHIYANDGPGIDLGGDGPTANDPLDTDTGANYLQNYPLLAVANAATAGTNVVGTFNSTPNTTYTLEFFANSACDTNAFGEGQFPLGTIGVLTNAAGNTEFNVTLPLVAFAGQTITATATDADGNTSEFSACLPVNSTLQPSPVSAGQVLISEFRLSGLADTADEFVELYNNTNTDLLVGTDDGTNGWSVWASDAAGRQSVFDVPAGTVIPARGHYLVTSAPYTLDATNVDMVYLSAINEGAGLALFKSHNPTTVNRLDAVGFSGVTDTLYREGAGFQPAAGISDGSDYSFVRALATGLPQDTDNNAADFVLVSTSGATSNGVPAQLGAPGPEGLTSPIQRNAQIKASLIDTGAPSTAAPNRVRDLTPVTNGAQGTLTIRRKFKNSTGAPVTLLRFRVVDITTLNTPNPGGAQADLRALTSTDVMVTTSTGNVLVKGTTLAQPLAQPQGGGLNSTLVVQLPGGALAPGASVNVQFVLGVQAGGRFRFLVNVEALP